MSTDLDTVRGIPPSAGAAGPADERESLASVLLRRFSVDPQALARAKTQAANTGSRLELVLAEQLLVSDVQMAVAMSEYLSMPAIPLIHFTPDPHLLKSLPQRIMTELRILPVGCWGDCLAVATHDPFDVEILDELRNITAQEIAVYIAPKADIENLLLLNGYGTGQSLAAILDNMETSPADAVAVMGEDQHIGGDEAPDVAEQAPVIRLVNAILIEGLDRSASDIHFEPTKGALQIRYRIDGVLYDAPSPPRHMHSRILSRIKILAHLDIAESRLPQDGRFGIRAANRQVDVRVSVVPTVNGEKAVLRLLDRQRLLPNVKALGLDAQECQQLCTTIHEPAGLVLVTGPTGSGKTTTLYSILQELNDPGVNIITVEDPVEYKLPRVNQIQARSDIGLTFSRGLRAVLRQDPDIVMIGEIRDRETATIAIQAAMTGHLVLSTLHTMDASGAVARLVNMGIETFLIASSLVMAQAQRLYRRLCPGCKRVSEMPHELLRSHDIKQERFRGETLYGPAGCVHCEMIGYRGRDVVMELLTVNEEIKDMIVSKARASELREAAMRNGMRCLRDIGLDRVVKGETSIQEILRVTARS